MENYNDEKLIDEFTAQKLAAAYSATLTALDIRKPHILDEQNNQQVNTPTTNELLSAILSELKALRTEIACNRKIRLGI